jgi:hypothetical protein
MEGPALAFKVLVILAVVMAIYRRFEKVHVPFREFERFVRSSPILIAIRAREPASIAERIRAGLDGERAFAGSGLRPWPFYSLTLAVEVSPGLVVIRTRDCALLRVEGRDPPDLVSILRDGIDGHAVDVWLHSDAWVDLESGTRSAHGWTIRDGDPTPCPELPSWLPRREPAVQSSPAVATSLT